MVSSIRFTLFSKRNYVEIELRRRLRMYPCLFMELSCRFVDDGARASDSWWFLLTGTHTCAARHSPNGIVRWLWIQAIVCVCVSECHRRSSRMHPVQRNRKHTEFTIRLLSFEVCMSNKRWPECRLPAASPRRQWKNDDFGNKIITNIHWWSWARAREFTLQIQRNGRVQIFISIVVCNVRAV